MTLHSEQLELIGYDAAQTGAVFYRVSNGGYMRLAGADRLDFIQRQTTNDVGLLAADTAVLTALTTGTARLMDVWRLVQDADDAIGVITLPGRGADAARYLQSRIFFKDQVTVADASAEFVQFEVFGPAARDALSACGVGVPEANMLAPFAVGDFTGRVIGLRGLIAQGWLVIVPAGHADSLAVRLVDVGAAALNGAAYDVLRIEAGLPGPERELINDYTPLENNLDAAISATKGCYAGQEIIARQITYDKVTKRLVGVKLAELVEPGAAVQVDARSAGTITSAARSPRLGPIALAVIKRPHFAPGTAISVSAAGERRVVGKTVALPFAE